MSNFSEADRRCLMAAAKRFRDAAPSAANVSEADRRDMMAAAKRFRDFSPSAASAAKYMQAFGAAAHRAGGSFRSLRPNGGADGR